MRSKPLFRRYTARAGFPALLCLLALCAPLTPALRAQAPVDIEDDEEGEALPAYVRRFSVGGRFSVLPLQQMDSGNLTSPVGNLVQVLAETKATARRLGGGITTQFLINDRFAVGLDFLFRRAAYTETTDVITDLVDPFTNEILQTELVTTIEKTRATIWETPVLIRYFAKDRRERGARAFFEGGLAIRRIGNVRSSTSTSFSTTDLDVDETDECCDATPAVPAHRVSLGAVVGIGFQLIDDIGVRVVPGVRFTRWFSNAFDSPPTRSAKNQLEATIALTF